MSKNLFNSNTFQSKNVTNSDDIANLNVDTFDSTDITVTNITAENITNDELQEATTGVAANLASLANKQDTLTTGNGINITSNVISFDGTSITGNLNLTGVNGNITTTGDVTAGSSLKYTDSYDVIKDVEEELGLKEELFSVTTPLIKNTVGSPNILSINTTTAPLEGSEALITAGGVYTELQLKEDDFNVSAPLIKNTIGTPNLLSIDTSNTPTFGGNQLVLSGGLYQYLKDYYNAKLSTTSTDQLEIIDNNGSGININNRINVKLAASAGGSETGLINGVVLNTELSSKQDTISVTDGIQLNSNQLSLTGSYSGGFSIGGTDFQMWNDTRGGAGTSNGRALVHNNIGAAGSKATSVLRVNYNSDYGAGTRIDSITGIKTNPDSSYDLKVNGNTDIGGVLSIAGYSNVKTALDAAGGGLVYTAGSNGGLGINSSNGFVIDLTNTNSRFEIPQSVRIEKDGLPQFLVEPASTSSNDAEIEIRGARNGSQSSVARLVFSNYDLDLTSTNELGRIDGRVTNASSNIGGMVFSNYANGSTRTGSLTMSSGGNWLMGGGTAFQDDYKLKVTGDVNLSGSNYIKPQLALFGYDKDNIGPAISDNWGNGSTQIEIKSDRRVGDSFCTTSSGVITLSKDGMYRIRVSAQTQSDGYNNRVSFMNYLRINSTDYDEVEEKNFFGWTYIRNNSDGGHGSISFEDIIYLTTGSTIQPRHKLETADDRDFNNTLPSPQIDNYLNIQVERLYDSNPITGT